MPPRVQQQLEQLRRQLAGLDASQKALLGVLVAVMAVTVGWWVYASGSNPFVPLLNQSLTSEQSGPIQSMLASRGIEVRAAGEQLLVPSARRDEALGVLSYERLMPADTTSHFDRAIDRIGSFDGRQKTDMVQRLAVQNDLAVMLRHLPGVRHATVQVDTTYQRQVGRDVLPTAAVTITTSGGADVRRVADAAAHTVASAVSMLSPSRVNVIVDGRRITIDDAGDGMTGGKHLELRASAERHFEEKLRSQLGYVPGLHVSVSVNVNDTVSRRSATSVNPDRTIIAPLQETQRTEESSGGGDGGAEAGMMPNVVGMAPASVSGGRPQRRSSETTESTNVVAFDRNQEETYQQAGGTRPVAASLSVPTSWLLGEFRNRHRTDSDPDPDALADFERQRLDELRQLAASTLDNLDRERITVVTYADVEGWGDNFAGFASTGVKQAGIAGDGLVGQLVRDYGRHAAAAALALVTLFLVSSMVRRTTPAEMPEVPSIEGEIFSLAGGDDLAGEVTEADGLLVAQEVDEQQLQAGQMVEQVQKLVKENPEAAASLVRRWLNA